MNYHVTNTDNPVDFPKSKDKVEEFVNKYASYIEGMSDEEWENLGKSYLVHTKGNLLDLAEAGEFDIVVQGCNCFNTMGGGIAREIRERYPMAATVDNETLKGDYNKLGNYTTAFTGKFLIVNAYTQYNMSRGTDVFEYTAFQLILEKLTYAFPGKRIGLPYIGMGLAGGDQNTIIPMIEWFAERIALEGGSVTLVEFG